MPKHYDDEDKGKKKVKLPSANHKVASKPKKARMPKKRG